MTLGCNEPTPRHPFLQQLCAQHTVLLELAAKLERACAEATKVPLRRVEALVAIRDLNELLNGHHALEEKQFLPLLGRIGRTNDAEHLLLEHHNAMSIVGQIRTRLAQNDGHAAVLARVFAGELRGHIEHEARIFTEIDAAG